MVLTVSAPAAATGPAAVVPLLVVNLEPEDADAVTQALADALSAGGAEAVRGGREVRRRLPLEGLSPACPAEPACLSDLRGRLEAGPLVFVVLARVGERLQVDPTVVVDAAAEARPALEGGRAELLSAAWLEPRVQGWLPRPAAPLLTGAPAAPASGWARPSWPVWAAAGLSLAALGTGVGLGVAARSGERGLVEAGCEARRCPDADIDPVAAKALGADVGYGLAAVAAAAAVGLYYVLDVDGAEVTVSASGAGAALTGRF